MFIIYFMNYQPAYFRAHKTILPLPLYFMWNMELWGRNT